MIRHQYDCLEGLKKIDSKELHDHDVLWYRIKKGNILVSMTQDKNDGSNTSWSILLIGMSSILNEAITEDQARDILEQRIVEIETSQVYGGTLFPRITIVK